MGDLEKLPRLIAKAIEALDKATTAAEVLEVKADANAAYEMAKAQAHLAKAKKAHETVLRSCRETQARALEIEARAQCRLADEYDAAQERGEAAKQGDLGRNRSSQQEHLSTVKDIGLTRKLIHEARIVRNAEKVNPGIVHKVLDEALKANREPTRADVRRAVRDSGNPNKDSKRTNRPRKSDRSKLDEAGRLALDGMARDEIVAKTGLKVHEVHVATERERGRREGAIEASVKVEDLPKTYQEKYAVLVRKFEREKDALVKQLAEEMSGKILDELLPRYQERMNWAEQVINARGGIFSSSEFRTLVMCLHPDRSASDQTLSTMLNKVQKHERVLVKATDIPTQKIQFPKNAAEAAAWKRKVSEERKARRATRRERIH